MTDRTTYKVRFFFEYGAGGCLWVDNDQKTFDAFGLGPIDSVIADKTGKLTPTTLEKIQNLDDRHADYLNKNYPLYPSLWRQKECDDFNMKVDSLFNQLTKELGKDFEITDRQERYKEDQDLERYLIDPKSFKR